jgi:hypothetical protein
LRQPVEGRSIETVAATGAAVRLLGLERVLVRAAGARRPVTRWALVAAMIIIVAGSVAALASDAVRRHLIVSTALIVVACVPLGWYVAGVFPGGGVASMGFWFAGFCVLAGTGARAVLGQTRALAAVLVVTAAVPLLDLLVGTPIAMRSPFAFQIAGGGRFYGVDDGVLGLVVGAALFATALVVDRARRARNATLWVALAFAAVVWLLGAPSFGAKFGAALTAVPSLGVLALRIGGRSIDAKTVAGLALAAVAVTGAFVGVDFARPPDKRTHIARAASGAEGRGSIVARKAEASVRIARTIWTPSIVVFGGSLLLIWWRRRDRFDRGLLGRDAHRAALAAAVVGVVAGIVFNDGGVVTAAPIALIAASSTLPLLLEPP